MDTVAQGTQQSAYADFVRAQWAPLYRTAYLMTGDHQRAEDAVQSALMKVYLAWGRVAAMDHPAAYTRKVLVHQLVSWGRRRSSREAPGLELVEPDRGFEDDLVRAQEVWSLVLALPPRQRAVVVLRYYEDRTESEIAEVLGISPGSVKTHAHHALATLRSRLDRSVGTTPVERRPDTAGGGS